MIASMAELSAYLAELRRQGKTEVRCELTPAFSARMSDAALTEALVAGLPMAQGVQCRIVRSRGRGALLTARLRRREGLRMLAGEGLSEREAAALELARSIAAEALRRPDEEGRFRYLYDWLCTHVRYAHTSAGQKGYEHLVGAAGALLRREANCQGFADALYLLCGLCGIGCEYRAGRGKKRLHVWNVVQIHGVWREADASRGARSLPAGTAACARNEFDNFSTNF